MAVWGGIGQIEKERLFGCDLLFNKADALLSEEIHRVAFIRVCFAIFRNLFAVKAAHMTVRHRAPIVKAGHRLGGIAKVVFTGQSGFVPCGLQSCGQGMQPVQSMPVCWPLVHLAVVNPAMYPMLRRQEPGQKRCPTG